MTLANNTDCPALALPFVAPDGAEVVVALVKASYVVRADGRAQLAEEQSPVRTNDVPRDPEARESSVRYPSDAGTHKRGVDVVVVGDAISPTPTRAFDVCVTVGRRSVPLRVHGERVFYEAAGGVSIGPAAEFQRRAVVYEYAYGGTSDDFGTVERRNPVGRGIAARTRDLIGKPAPCIEDPRAPLSGTGSSVPVGYGAIASHWLPRSDFAGTFDEVWHATRMPLMPLDFDPRYFNVAHPSLQFDELAPGTPIAVLGMSERSSWTVALPDVALIVRGRRDDGKLMSGAPRVDTVVVEPERNRIEVTLRQVFPKGRGATLLREIQVDT